MSSLADAIRALFSTGVVVRCGVPGEVEGELMPEEAKVLGRSVEKRRREFAAGRLLARSALLELGHPPAPLLPAEDRAPIWPAGVVGSISHTKGFCAVVVARRGELRALGLDVEELKPMKPSLAERICTSGELDRIRSHTADEAERGRLAKLVFSAKEAFYKCQYPLTRRFLEFHDVELDLDLDLDPADGRFTARVAPEADELPEGLVLAARFAIADGLVACAVEAR